MKKLFKKVMKIFLSFLTAFLFSCSQPSLAVSSEVSGDFEITMLDVGQGLAVLIKADDHYLLYDGGGRETSSYVVSYLQEHGVDALDYVIVSHYDEDHLAGVIGVMNVFPVLQLLCPDYEPDTWLYDSFRDMEKEKNISKVFVSAQDSFAFGEAEIRILGPVTCDHEEENNNSVVAEVSYGSFSILLTGDAEKEEEEEILSLYSDLHADVMTAAHHGSSTSSSSAFLDAVDPSYVLISCGKGNDYGHPHASVMNALKQRKVMMFRSDLQSEVTIWYYGGKVNVSTYPCDVWDAGEIPERSAAIQEYTEAEGGTEYVLNTHTMKFHLPECTGIKDMNEKNRLVVITAREELISSGYEPCGNCRP